MNTRSSFPSRPSSSSPSHGSFSGEGCPVPPVQRFLCHWHPSSCRETTPSAALSRPPSCPCVSSWPLEEWRGVPFISVLCCCPRSSRFGPRSPPGGGPLRQVYSPLVNGCVPMPQKSRSRWPTPLDSKRGALTERVIQILLLLVERFLLNWMPEIEVLPPAELRASLAKTLHQALAIQAPPFKRQKFFWVIPDRPCPVSAVSSCVGIIIGKLTGSLTKRVELPTPSRFFVPRDLSGAPWSPSERVPGNGRKIILNSRIIF